MRASDRVAKPALATPDFRRRRVLQGMLSGGVLAFAGIDPAAAQSSVSLVASPRRALVIGNSQYKENPLRNPASDANAMAQALQRTGFNVALLLDAGRDQMRNAIQAYGDSLAKQSAIGLFYFAGHGMQLAWRNYLIPVDAVVDNPDDVRERAVDLNALLQGLTRAKNPMNMIILDACRDNPFGTRITTGQKGLSQFDAPPGSLLAYATAPGNVASDGDGANGLYTENLLREIAVPEAKIEDVFKRVRLQVRRKTNGQQIPWESTSLEEDFYFVPPRAIAEEAERERQREAAAREKQRAVEEAERKRRQQEELAALERKRAAEEAELRQKRELALKEAQRVAEEAERKRREEQALREAKLAEEEAARKYREELALRDKQLAAEEAERKRKEEQAAREARLAQEEAERKRGQARAQPAGKPDARPAERQFEEELALWERIKDSKDAKPLEDYLLRYPSGRYSELAQLQLDRVLAAQGEKRIEIVSAAENPFTKGTVVADTRRTVGDTYTYRVTDLYTKLETERFTETITSITDTEILYSNGVITDRLGNLRRTRDGSLYSATQFLPHEFAVGKRWTTRFKVTNPRDQTGEAELDFRIATRESITVPAGTFNAFRLEFQGWSIGPWGSLNVIRKSWLAPDQVRRLIVSEDFRKLERIGRVISSDRQELVSYRQA